MSRNLPLWMRPKTRSHSEEIIVPKDKTDGEIPKRRLRSNHTIEETKPVVQKLIPEDHPFIQYKGSIVYCTTAMDMTCACDKLLQYVESVDNIVPIAFDMEWPFSFKTGSGKSALIQLCADTSICYLLQISEVQKLPSALIVLLKHPRVRCHGVNIKNDFRKLARDFPVDVEPMIANCLDLGVWANSILNSSGRWSLERLVLQICKLRINKDKSVRMSQWNVVPLSENQQLYAAIDVYIGQVIYLELEALEKQCITACNIMKMEDDF